MLRLKVLGGLAMETDGARVDVRERKGLLLLAIVAIATNGGMSRARLHGLFWPDADEERASNNLRQRLFGLRRDLGAADLLIGGPELRLNPEAIQSDVSDLETALAATDVAAVDRLYAAALLEGVFTRDSPELERWIDERRSQLAARVAAALAEAAKSAAKRGDHQESARLWRRVSSIEPLSTEAARGLMTALRDAGDSAAALQHLRVHEALLRAELGVEPAVELTDLASSLRSRLSAPTGAAAPGAETASRETTAASPEQAPEASRSPRRGYILLAAASIAALLLLGRLALRDQSTTADARVAVLPFVDATGDSSWSSLGDITAEWVTQGLVQSGMRNVLDSRVVLVESTNGDSLSGDEPMRRAAALGAGTVVAGSFARRSDSLVFEARLVDVVTAQVLRPIPTIVVPASDAMRGVDLVRQRVSGAFAMLRDSLVGRALVAVVAPPTYEAYREYMQGLRWMGRDWNRALPHLEKALERDSSFVQAALWVAEASHAVGRPRADLLHMLSARADSLAPYERAHLEYMIAFDANEDKAALAAARRMTEVGPSSADALYARGYLALATYRIDEAIQSFENIDLSRSWMGDWWLWSRWPTQAYHHARRFDDERRVLRNAQRRFPRNFELCQAELIPLAASGRTSDLETKMEECSVRPDEDRGRRVGRMLLIAANELHAHGHRRQSERFVERLLTLSRADHDAGKLDDVALGDLSFAVGRWEDALQTLTPRIDTANARRPRIAGMVGVAAARIGDTTTVRAMRGWLARPGPTGGARFPASNLWLARIAASEDSVEEVVRRLAGSNAPMLQSVHADRAFEGMRDRREFQALFRER